ncbi:MAG: pyridoxine 5'-phosphate synthase [Deltaproteobacteria bacterium]|nr:pyridoxine 5'-phosphate synthase [Deltaproteobacteria bacterium]
MVRLGVNIDHVATVRQARRVWYPDPVEAALLAEKGGADGITVHLREDRRHIHDQDVERLKASIATKLNLEMAAIEEMVEKALVILPQDVCLVPERRQELTTEGGLDVEGNQQRLQRVIARLKEGEIRVSLFVNPELLQIRAAQAVNADAVEIHTGPYCETVTPAAIEEEHKKVVTAVEYGRSLGLIVNAGHGLRYDNVAPIAAIPGIHELNIGHSIVARAVLVGMERAVWEMKEIIVGGRG